MLMEDARILVHPHIFQGTKHTTLIVISNAQLHHRNLIYTQTIHAKVPVQALLESISLCALKITVKDPAITPIISITQTK